MTLAEIKQRLTDAAKVRNNDIRAIGEDVLRHPELGFKEEETSALVREQFKALGLQYQYPLAITGACATLRGRDRGANICIMGELDAVKCAGHPWANDDGDAHACGHHVQIAAMLGAAMLLRESGVMEQLDGDVTFFAVPAEEFIDLDYRLALKKEGKICALGGKQQLIAEGAFDGIDVAMMIHATAGEDEKLRVHTCPQTLGFVAKKITFFGKAAHGSMPYDGTNALNAAALAILGIHSNRETFRDEDKIRIHPIITKGGDVVNSVPDEVCIDTYVRGASLEAIEKGSAAVHRAVNGAAQMIGAGAEIESMAGYLPLCEDAQLNDVFVKNAIAVLGEDGVIVGDETLGSTDAGDLSQLLPTIHPTVGGFCGKLHSRELAVCDPDTYTASALMLALTAAELLYDGASLAKKIKTDFAPKMTKQEYLQYVKEK